MSSANKWIGLTLLATLVIGMGAGILVDRFLLAPAVRSDTRSEGDRDGRHRDHRARMLERFRTRLDLSADQVSQLEDVINRNHETAQEYWQNSRRNYETLRKQFRADIRSLLTEEQKAEFDVMVAEYEAKSRDRDQRGDR